MALMAGPDGHNTQVPSLRAYQPSAHELQPSDSGRYGSPQRSTPTASSQPMQRSCAGGAHGMMMPLASAGVVKPRTGIARVPPGQNAFGGQGTHSRRPVTKAQRRCAGSLTFLHTPLSKLRNPAVVQSTVR